MRGWGRGGVGDGLTSAFVDSDDFAERDIAVGLDIVARFHTHFVGENHSVRDTTRKMIGAHGSTQCQLQCVEGHVGVERWRGGGRTGAGGNAGEMIETQGRWAQERDRGGGVGGGGARDTETERKEEGSLAEDEVRMKERNEGKGREPESEGNIESNTHLSTLPNMAAKVALVARRVSDCGLHLQDDDITHLTGNGENGGWVDACSAQAAYSRVAHSIVGGAHEALLEPSPCKRHRRVEI